MIIYLSALAHTDNNLAIFLKWKKQECINIIIQRQAQIKTGTSVANVVLSINAIGGKKQCMMEELTDEDWGDCQSFSLFAFNWKQS